MGKLKRFRRGLIGTGSALVFVFFEQLIYIESLDGLDVFLQTTTYTVQASSTNVPKVAVRMHFLTPPLILPTNTRSYTQRHNHTRKKYLNFKEMYLYLVTLSFKLMLLQQSSDSQGYRCRLV